MDLENEIAEINKALGSIEANISNICKLVDKHDKMLIGNGRIGIKNQVRLLWAAFILALSVALKNFFNIRI